MFYIFTHIKKYNLKKEAYASLLRNLNKNAAIAAPTKGATINTHTCLSVSPPKKIAGAKLLAGLTEVPVKLIPSK